MLPGKCTAYQKRTDKMPLLRTFARFHLHFCLEAQRTWISKYSIFQEELATEFDKQRSRFITSQNENFLILDMADLDLKGEIFDAANNIFFGDLQGLPLYFRLLRPSFTAFGEHAMSAAIYADKMGWSDGPDIVTQTYMFHDSSDKAPIKKISEILWDLERSRINKQHFQHTFYYFVLLLCCRPKSESASRFGGNCDVNRANWFLQLSVNIFFPTWKGLFNFKFPILKC